jgi:flagellar hook-basal body complex protein FliE
MTIDGITRLLPGAASTPIAPAAAAATEKAGPTSFADVLADSLAQVKTLQCEADQAIGQLGAGGPASLHDTLVALDQADLSFRLMMQVRNKIVEAYQEVLRMQA